MKKLVFPVLAVLTGSICFGQEGDTKKIDVNVNTSGGAWYTSPWVWIVGAAVFILLLVALSRGGGRRAD